MSVSQDKAPVGEYADRGFLLLDGMPLYLAGLIIAAALLLGGVSNSGYLSDTILQFISLLVLVYAFWRLSLEELDVAAKLCFLFCLSLFAVPLIQLIPLPPEMWTALPGRDAIVSSLEAAGLESGWMPLSVSPRATWLSLAALLPPISVFSITLLVGYRGRRLLSLVIIAVGFISAFVGLLQVAQGPSSPLYFFGSDGTREVTGFFANRNHFSALIYCLIMLVAAWLAGQTGNAYAGPAKSGLDAGAMMRLLAGISLIVILIGIQMMARSRAGVGLTIFALLGAYALTLGIRHQGGSVNSRKVMVGIGALVLVFMLSTQFALYRIMSRFDSNLLEGGRATIARTTTEAAWSFMPTGSGIGTFVPVYAMFEKATDLRANKFINRAHNDLLEFWLEVGMVAFVLMSLFMLFFVARTLKVWRYPRPGGEAIDQTLARAASIIIGLLIAHSLVDYPLRTGTMASLFAFACALLISPLAGVGDIKGGWFSAALKKSGLPKRMRTHEKRQRDSATFAKDEAPPMAPPEQPAIIPATSAPKPIEQTDWGKDIAWPPEWVGEKKLPKSDGPDQ